MQIKNNMNATEIDIYLYELYSDKRLIVSIDKSLFYRIFD